ncbi:MAG: hypothetical protein V3U27_08900, partial [Candidatus Tectomicrobia bacterium]
QRGGGARSAERGSGVSRIHGAFPRLAPHGSLPAPPCVFISMQERVLEAPAAGLVSLSGLFMLAVTGASSTRGTRQQSGRAGPPIP